MQNIYILKKQTQDFEYSLKKFSDRFSNGFSNSLLSNTRFRYSLKKFPYVVAVLEVYLLIFLAYVFRTLKFKNRQKLIKRHGVPAPCGLTVPVAHSVAYLLFL